MIRKQVKKQDKILLFAGNGDLPRIVAEELKYKKSNFEIFCFIEDCNSDTSKNKDKNHTNNNFEYFTSSGYQAQKIYLSNIADIIKKVKQSKAKKVVCCGGIRFNGLKSINWFNLKIIKYGLKVLFAKTKGDNFLLNIAEKIIQDCGCELVGVQDVVPNLICNKKDAINVDLCSKKNNEDIKLGLKILQDISKYDIGQAIIIQDGRVLAMEGVEGTNELLDRSKNYKTKSKVKPVLVKSAKIGQNQKLDLPTIGLDTFKQIAKNGFCGIAVKAGSTILLDRDKVRKMCVENRLFLFVV